MLAAEKLLGIEVPRRGQLILRALQRNRAAIVTPATGDHPGARCRRAHPDRLLVPPSTH